MKCCAAGFTLLFLFLSAPDFVRAQDVSPDPELVSKVWSDFYRLCDEADRAGNPAKVLEFRNRAAKKNGFPDWEAFVYASKKALSSEEWVRIQGEAHRAYKEGLPPLKYEVFLRVRIGDPSKLERTRPGKDDLARAVAVVARLRLQEGKVPGAKVEVADRDSLVIRFMTAGPKQTEGVKRLVLSRGNLRFRLVAKDKLADLFRGKAAPPGHAWRPYRDDAAGLAPELVMLDDGYNLGREIIEKAYDAKDWAGSPAVGFRIRPAFQEAFAQFTSENSSSKLGPGKGRKVAILLDGKILSAPVMQSMIRKSGIITSGNKGFKPEARDHLVATLNSGCYPVRVVLESEGVMEKGKEKAAGAGEKGR